MRPAITKKFSMWPSVENVCPPLCYAITFSKKLTSSTSFVAHFTTNLQLHMSATLELLYLADLPCTYRVGIFIPIS